MEEVRCNLVLVKEPLFAGRLSASSEAFFCTEHSPLALHRHFVTCFFKDQELPTSIDCKEGPSASQKLSPAVAALGS